MSMIGRSLGGGHDLSRAQPSPRGPTQPLTTIGVVRCACLAFSSCISSIDSRLTAPIASRE
jgi:hypothetical protein